MAKARAEILASLQSEDTATDALRALLRRHAATSDTFDFEEFFQALPARDHARFWEAVLGVCLSVLQRGAWMGADDGVANRTSASAESVAGVGQEEHEAALALLLGVVQMVRLFCGVAARAAPEPLVDTVIALHSILFYLPAGAGARLQLAAACMCADWWAKGRARREEVVTQTLPVLLVRALEEGGGQADVKRLLTVADCLSMLDFEDDSIDSLKDLLLRCVAHPVFLQAQEGRRFLAGLFALHAPFSRDLHAAVKTQLPAGNRRVLEAYGDVYFRAWQLLARVRGDADGEEEEGAEEAEAAAEAARGGSDASLAAALDDCLRDLVDHVIHARSHALLRSLLRVLSVTHAQRQKREVEALMHRLYSPALWPALSVANPLVRRNAVTLLAEVYPLRDPSAGVQAKEEQLTRLHDVMLSLLDDPDAGVREVAVQTACRVLGVFWELVPPATASGLLLRIVRDLAVDAASAAVRAAAVSGVTYVLRQQPLSHEPLRALLPALGPVLHDKRERVRVAFCELLLCLRPLRAIRFYSVAPLDHILARLAADAHLPAVAARLTDLLMPSFCPANATGTAQTSRAVALMRRHPLAARAFFRHAHRFMAVQHVAKLVLLLHCAIAHAMEKGSTSVRVQDSGRKRRAEDVAVAASGSEEEEEEGQDSGLRADDLAIMGSLLDAIAVLWASIAHKLASPAHAASLKRLRAAFGGDAAVAAISNEEAAATDAAGGRRRGKGRRGSRKEDSDEQANGSPRASLAMLMASYADDGTCRGALLRIASLMASEDVPLVKEELLPQVLSLPADAAAEQMAPLLDCLCEWRAEGVVVTRAVASLATALAVDVSDLASLASGAAEASGGGGGGGGGRKRRGGARVPASAATSLPPPLAARMLLHMLGADVAGCRGRLLCAEEEGGVREALRRVGTAAMHGIRNRCAGFLSGVSAEVDDVTLTAALQLSLKAALHEAVDVAQGMGCGGVVLPAGLAAAMDWAEVCAMPSLATATDGEDAERVPAGSPQLMSPPRARRRKQQAEAHTPTHTRTQPTTADQMLTPRRARDGSTGAAPTSRFQRARLAAEALWLVIAVAGECATMADATALRDIDRRTLCLARAFATSAPGSHEAVVAPVAVALARLIGQTALSVSAHQFRADASAPSCDGAVWRALSTLLRVAPEAAWDAAKRGAAACVGAERMRGGETQEALRSVVCATAELAADEAASPDAVARANGEVEELGEHLSRVLAIGCRAGSANSAEGAIRVILQELASAQGDAVRGWALVRVLGAVLRPLEGAELAAVQEAAGPSVRDAVGAWATSVERGCGAQVELASSVRAASEWVQGVVV